MIAKQKIFGVETSVRPFRIHYKGVTYKGNRRVHKHPSFGLFRWYTVVHPTYGYLYMAQTIDSLKLNLKIDRRSVPFDHLISESYKTRIYHGD